MKLTDLILLCKQQDIELKANKGKLKILAPAGALTAELKQLLLEHKENLLKLLSTADMPKFQVLSKDAITQGAPLSFAQNRLWIMSALENSSASYNSSFALKIVGDLDVLALEKAFHALIMRHEVLRTCIQTIDGQPMQVLQAMPDFALACIDISALAQTEQQETIASHAQQSANQAFDLAHDTMLRACIVKCSPSEHVLIITLHHIACDGWSMPILTRELNTLYGQFVAGESAQLPTLAIQYRDYASWQRQWLQDEVLTQAMDYWRERLQGLPEVHQLPLDKARPPQPSYRGAMYQQSLPAHLKQGLQGLSEAHNSTLFMTVQTAFALLLSRFSGEDDIVMGTAVANREQQEVSELVGLFANTLVLRTQFSDEQSFSQLLSQSRQALLADFAHQYVPFELLVETLNPTRQLSYNPLFQVMLLWQNNEQVDMQLSDALHFSDYDLARDVSKFELTLTVVEEDDGLSLYWRYATDLLSHTTVAGWANSFATLLSNLIAQPEKAVKRVGLLTTEDKQQLIASNANEKHFDSPKCLHQWFEQQAQASGDEIAVICGGQALSYRALNAQANQVAYRLTQQGVQANTIVGICTRRHSHMLAGMLGILKAGAAYMPLDPSYPLDRLHYMLADSQAHWVVGEQACLAQLGHPASGSIVFEHLSEQTVAPVALASSMPTDMAYVIYTSGSTGHPKGVMVTHQAVCHFLNSANERLSSVHSAHYQWLAVTAMSFDISILELFLPLCQGGTVVMAQESEVQDGQALSQLLEHADINVMQATPATWKLLKETNWQGKAGLQVLIGGEYVPESLGVWLSSHALSVFNCYGPTESTVWTHMNLVAHQGQQQGHSVSALGGLLSNVQQLVVSRDGELAPLGGVGELWLSGAGLAKGYWQRSELTQEKFIDRDLLGATHRWYRTGDWVKQGHHGELTYLGRIDDQVKVRGYRIELGEIEQCLLQMSAIVDVAVKLHQRSDGQESQLVAYAVLTSGDEALEEAQWREHLQTHLPSYMHPVFMMVLAALPLTANGKVDRRALPAPDYQQAEYVEAETEIEQQLASLWCELLGLEHVSVTANFFALGGHSLLATRMLNRLSSEHGLFAELKEIFLHPSIKRLALQLVNQPINMVPELLHEAKEKVPASYAQTRLCFLERLRPVAGAYHINSLLKVEQPLDMTCFEAVILQLIQRHPSLRTNFVQEGNELYQIVREKVSTNIAVFDLTGMAKSTQNEKINALCNEQKFRPLDLSADNLLQIRVIKTDDKAHYVFFTFHHIISDGWSTDIFLHELQQLYRAEIEGLSVHLPKLSFTYQDYSQWQKNWLQKEGMDTLLAYWTKRLSGMPMVHQLPLDRSRPATPSYNGAIQRVVIKKAVYDNFKALLKSQNTSLFVGLKALLSVLMSRFSGEKDIVIGTAVANRHHKALEGVMGYFANTLVLRNHLEDNQSFFNLLDISKDEFLADFEHQHIPFEVLVNALNPERNVACNPLFQIMLVLQSQEIIEECNSSMPADIFVSQDQNTAASQFDLTLGVREEGDELVFAWRYATDLFDEQTITLIANAMKQLIEVVVLRPQDNVHALPIFAQSEVEQHMHKWNQTECEFERANYLAHELFEHWVEQAPDNIALVFNDQQLTYAQLNRRANQLARLLIQSGAQKETLVGIYMHPSLDMVVALLASLKAGAAYLALDPSYPESRLQYMLTDSKSTLVVCSSDLAQELEVFTQITLIDPEKSELERFSSANLLLDEVQISSQNLAYAIYTSGSTGQPKGVILEHGGLVNHALSQSQLFQVNQKSKVMQYAGLSFDVATCEMFLALSSGAQLHLIDSNIKKQPSLLSQYIHTQKLTHLLLIPSVLELLSPELMTSVASIIVGGESISLPQADFWSRKHKLFNAYGPSEATICALADEYQQAGITIGHPIDNMSCFILDKNRNLVPQGVPGELYLAGKGLARGYINQETLTQTKFINHSFENGEKARLYCTGDLVKRRSDGKIEFLGRTDSQVKIRGFRIEMDEVATQLNNLSKVKFSVVAAQILDTKNAQADKVLVAYIVHKDVIDKANWDQEVAKFKKQLATKLPGYMLPTAYIQMTSLPLLENGKVNHKALPNVVSADLIQTGDYEPAVTDTQHNLCTVLSDALGIEKIGLNDNFFRLGGNSILAMKLISKVNQIFAITLPLLTLFEVDNVRELAEHIDNFNEESQSIIKPPITSLDLSLQNAPLSFEQQRTWFLYQVDEKKGAYNASRSLKIAGDLDVLALEKAFHALIMRHEVLRTCIQTIDGQPMQVLQAMPDFAIACIDISALAQTEQQETIASHAQQSANQAFDLAHDTMLRACIVKCSPSEHVLIITLHHIACDGWSMPILTRELNTLYGQFVAGESAQLPTLAIQYRDYASWQRQWLQDEVLTQAMDYWRERLQGLPEVHQLPLDKARPPQPSYRGAMYQQSLPAHLKQGLQGLSEAHNSTLFMTVQTAFALLLSRFSGEDDIVMGTAVANREQQEVSELVGLFANTLVLRTQFSDEQSFSQLLSQSRQALLADFAHQYVPFELLVETLNPTRQLSYNPLFQVMLLWQNNEQVDMQLSDALHFSDYDLARDVSKFELTLTVVEEDDGLSLYWRYATDLLSHTTVAGWANSFATLLSNLIAQPEKAVKRVGLLTTEDKQQLIASNANEKHFDSPKCLHQWFEQQAQASGDEIAVICGGQALSYRALNAQANQVAYRLTQQGVQANTIVGICTRRHSHMLAGMLGILKAGAAYMPLDPSYPLDRLHYMLADSQAHWVVGEQACLAQLGHPASGSIVFEHLSEQTVAPVALASSMPTDMAYVIYTSGSTGHPKGVMVTHQAVCHFLNSANERLSSVHSAHYQWLAVTAMSFDISILELFLPLCQGGTVVMAQESEVQDGQALSQLLEHADINVMQATPATWKLLKETNWQGKAGLQVLIGGEYVPESLGVWLSSHALSVFNCYGPTESTVWTHMNLVAHQGQQQGHSVSALGGLLSNVQQLVVSRDGELAPLGGVGELWLSGAGLAKGYWQRSELTQEKFIDRDLLGATHRWYRTGDWVKQGHHGELTYLGRIDDQVKVRGYRIELGEIEQCLLQMSAIVDVAVKLHQRSDGQESQLVAYAVLTSGDEALEEAQWREHLQTHLPSYMHPVFMMVLAALPLTANGKVDRRALPAPDYQQAEYVEAETEIEQQLASLWCELLGLEHVSVTANFFALGGHSLLVTRLASRLAQQMQMQVPIKVVFAYPTIRLLAQWLDIAVHHCHSNTQQDPETQTKVSQEIII